MEDTREKQISGRCREVLVRTVDLWMNAVQRKNVEGPGNRMILYRNGGFGETDEGSD